MSAHHAVAGALYLARLGDLITHMTVEVEAMQELGGSIREALAVGGAGAT